jgi:hypothetical protein
LLQSGFEWLSEFRRRETGPQLEKLLSGSGRPLGMKTGHELHTRRELSPRKQPLRFAFPTGIVAFSLPTASQFRQVLTRHFGVVLLSQLILQRHQMGSEMAGVVGPQQRFEQLAGIPQFLPGDSQAMQLGGRGV